MARLIALVLFSILSFVARADAPATPVEYSQDWEGDEFEVLSGWLAYIDAFDPDCTTYPGLRLRLHHWCWTGGSCSRRYRL